MARGLNPQDLPALVDALSGGDWVSGEQLAARAGVSRAALAKRVLHLRRWGLEIEGHAGRGYRLLRPLQRLRADAIREALPAGWRDGIRVIVCDVTDSTNTQALAASSAQDPQVWLAEMQTAGRGRRGRAWISPFGANLYLSLAWSFVTWPAELPSLSLVAGVAVASALEEFGFQDVGLKWPNDLLWQGRKLAGILLEQQGEVQASCRAVIGVGVNFDMQPAQLGDQALPPWCSLAQIAAQQGLNLPERNVLAARITGRLAEACARFACAGFADFSEAWSQRDLTRRCRIEISGAGETRAGIGGGIDASGALILLTERGAERVFAGDVSLRLGDGV